MIEPQPAHPFTWTSRPWGRALESSLLGSIAPHLFTTRDLALRGPHSEGGWAQLAATAGVRPERLVRLKQVHGVAAFIVHAGERRPPVQALEDGWPRADIAMTDDPDVAVAVQVADCLPILLADPTTGAVAAVHAGWRGTAAGVARVAVAAMTRHFGARPEALVAAIGPGIGTCCYQVGADVLRAFRAAGFAAEDTDGWFRAERGTSPGAIARHSSNARYRLDVAKANVDQLRSAGVRPASISACGLCTACHPSLFPSYRREGPGTGRIAGIIRPRNGR